MSVRAGAFGLCGWLLVVFARAACADDAFGLGDGHDGNLTVTAPGTVVNVYTVLTGFVSPTEIQVASVTGILVGDLVMLWRPAGFPPPPAGRPSPINISSSVTGSRELARVLVVSAPTLVVTPLVNVFEPGITQVVKVPEYMDATIGPGSSLVAQPWDGFQGGLVAFLATGTVTVIVPGQITANGAGFQGGDRGLQNTVLTGCVLLNQAPPDGARKGEGIAGVGPTGGGFGNVFNGAGGGNCAQTGGGGGGHSGLGGEGGFRDALNSFGGRGGTTLVYSLADRMMMGGGGGAGNQASLQATSGGTGGGAVFIRAHAIVGSGRIGANGASVPNGTGDDGQGGGGAGGSVHLRLMLAGSSCSVALVQARGGAGGTTTVASRGPGGGGGGGHVFIQNATPATSTIDVSGGLGGTSGGAANGATNGQIGTIETPTPVALLGFSVE